MELLYNTLVVLFLLANQEQVDLEEGLFGRGCQQLIKFDTEITSPNGRRTGY